MIEFKEGSNVYTVIVSMVGSFVAKYIVKEINGLDVVLSREMFGTMHDFTYRIIDIETCFYNTFEETKTHL